MSLASMSRTLGRATALAQRQLQSHERALSGIAARLSAPERALLTVLSSHTQMRLPAQLTFPAAAPFSTAAAAAAAGGDKPLSKRAAKKQQQQQKQGGKDAAAAAAAAPAAESAYKPRAGKVPTPQPVVQAEQRVLAEEREARLEDAYEASETPVMANSVYVTVPQMSRMLVPTARDMPADAVTRSHQLLLRAGYIKQLSSGHYMFLPLAQRVLAKVEAAVHAEMQAVGGQALSMPQVMTRALWEETGRWTSSGSEMFRLKDRNGHDLCLGPTHEEPFTALVRDVVESHKQLPLTLYQIGRKFRDEGRPRGGLLRCREFVMKDAYSFDADYEAAQTTYKNMMGAYKRVFARLGVPAVQVEADSGNIGGSLSHEYHVISPAGEDTLLQCDMCGYTANQEKAAFQVSAEFDHKQHAERLRAGQPTNAMRCDPRAVGLFNKPAQQQQQQQQQAAAAASAPSAAETASLTETTAALKSRVVLAAPTRLGDATVSAGLTVGAKAGMGLPAAPKEDAAAATTAASAADAADKAVTAAIRNVVSALAKRLLPAGARKDVPFVANVCRLTFHPDKAAAGDMMQQGPFQHHVLVLARADREINDRALTTFFSASEAEVLPAEQAAQLLLRYQRFKTDKFAADKAAGLVPATATDPFAKRPHTHFAQVDLNKMADWDEEGDTASINAEVARIARENLSVVDDGGLAVLTDSSLVASGHDIDALGLEGYSDGELAAADTSRPLTQRSGTGDDAMGRMLQQQDTHMTQQDRLLAMQEDAFAAADEKALHTLEGDSDDDAPGSLGADGYAEEDGANQDMSMLSMAPTQGDFTFPADGDRCIQHACSSQGTLRPHKGIEVGHVFYLGQRYSGQMKAAVTDAQGEKTTIEMGCYGIGVSRLLSAAIEAEGGADEHGIVWPETMAPYSVYVTAIGKPGATPAPAAGELSAFTKYQNELNATTRGGLAQLGHLMQKPRTSSNTRYTPLPGKHHSQQRAAAAAREAADDANPYRGLWDWGDADNSTHAQRIAALLASHVPYLEDDVLVDDRHSLSPGARFKDATLMGFPWLLVVGRDMQKDGRVELQHRRTGVSQLMTIDELVAFFNGHTPVEERAEYDAAREKRQAQAEAQALRMHRAGLPVTADEYDIDANDVDGVVGDDARSVRPVEFDFALDRDREIVDERMTSAHMYAEQDMEDASLDDIAAGKAPASARQGPPHFMTVLGPMRGPNALSPTMPELRDMIDAGVLFEDAQGHVRVDERVARENMHIVRGDRFKGLSPDAVTRMLALEDKAARLREEAAKTLSGSGPSPVIADAETTPVEAAAAGEASSEVLTGPDAAQAAAHHRALKQQEAVRRAREAKQRLHPDMGVRESGLLHIDVAKARSEMPAPGAVDDISRLVNRRVTGYAAGADIPGNLLKKKGGLSAFMKKGLPGSK